MGKLTYKSYADNDFERFEKEYLSGDAFWGMAADAQEICEKYLKHIIGGRYQPETDDEERELQDVLHTRNITRLLNFLEDKMSVQVNPDLDSKIRLVNGYYFTTRYPGPESIEVTKRDIDIGHEAIVACRKLVRETEKSIDEECRDLHEIEEESR